MAVQAVLGDIELTADEPLCMGSFPVQNSFVGFSPHNVFFGPKVPETLRVLNRLIVQSVVGGPRGQVGCATKGRCRHKALGRTRKA